MRLPSRTHNKDLEATIWGMLWLGLILTLGVLSYIDSNPSNLLGF